MGKIVISEKIRRGTTSSSFQLKKERKRPKGKQKDEKK